MFCSLLSMRTNSFEIVQVLIKAVSLNDEPPVFKLHALHGFLALLDPSQNFIDFRPYIHL